MGDDVVAAARSWVGTPYHDFASLKGVGCDCLGLILGVWRDVTDLPTPPIPNYVRGWNEMGPETMLGEFNKHLLVINGLAPVHGSVVVFRPRKNMIAKHCGIITTDRAEVSFIHALDTANGCGSVREEWLSQRWKTRMTALYRYPIHG